MVALFTLLALAAAAPVFVAARPTHTRSALPGQWYQNDDHPVHALFRRQAKRASPSPSVGSDSWTAQYPQSTPDTSKLPQAWVNALNDAVSAGKIPDIPSSTSSNGNSPVYPGDVNANRNNATVCAATDRECRIPEDIWDAPDGIIGIGFDDGPTQSSPMLYEFLQEQNQTATHYMIGMNVLNNWEEFLIAYSTNKDDIAVHTWTHPHMTTLTSLQVLAELAWTVQIIYDSTGGKVPRFWRPPYGDIDTRVSAIAREVLGLTAVLWNQDTEDWSMSSGGTTLAKIQSNMEQWLGGPKSPGLIILEHELTNETIQAFETAWPLVAQNNWKPVSQALMNSTMPAYQDGNEADAAFNSLIVSETSSAASSSATASASASGNVTHSASSSSSSVTSSSHAAQGAASSGSSPIVRPSLAIFGLLLVGALTLV